MYLKLINAPAIEPVTVSEVKLCAHIDDDTEDTIITRWIKTARVMAENYQGRSYITQSWERSFDLFPDLPIFLPRSPLVGVMTIKYTDSSGDETVLYNSGLDPFASTTTTAAPLVPPTTNGDFIIDTSSEPGRIGFAYLKRWPSITLQPIDGIKIRYIAGYGDLASDVPEYVKDAIMLYCTYRNENRAGEVAEMPRHILDLLRPDRMYQ